VAKYLIYYEAIDNDGWLDDPNAPKPVGLDENEKALVAGKLADIKGALVTARNLAATDAHPAVTAAKVNDVIAKVDATQRAVRKMPGSALAVLVALAVGLGGCHYLPKPHPVPSPSPAPSPTPTPAPSPTPSPYACTVDPTTGNYPVPPGNTCPACWADSLGWVGITFEGRVGNRYNFGATPHSAPPYCGHAPGLKCEQWKPQGGGCQDPAGPDMWLSREGGWPNGGPTWQRCDKFSDNNWRCHHNTGPGEAGPTTACAVPPGEPPWSARGRCVTVNVQP
jgi:hypothetical protein